MNIFFQLQRKVVAKESTTKNRPKRNCTEIGVQRFGTTESSVNHNSFFENLVTTNTDSGLNNDLVADNSRETCNWSNDNSDGTSTQLFQLLISKVNVMLENMVRLEVKIDNIQLPDHRSGNALGMVNVAMLNKLGLPVQSANELKSLEDSLNEDVKRDEMVKLKYLCVF